MSFTRDDAAEQLAERLWSASPEPQQYAAEWPSWIKDVWKYFPMFERTTIHPEIPAVDFKVEHNIHREHSAFDGGSHGYSLALRPDLLRKWADMSVGLLPGALAGRSPVFIYRGFSGIAMGTAIILALKHSQDYGVIMCRKEGEKTHGGEQEYSISRIKDKKKWVLVFVDDLIDSGRTRREVFRSAQSYMEACDRYREDSDQYYWPRVEPSYFVQILKNQVNTVPWSILETDRAG